METTTTEAHGDGRMIAEARTEIVHAVGRLAVLLEGTVTGETDINTAMKGENDLQVQQRRITEGADTAVIDTATIVNATVNVTANDHHEDIEALDIGLVPHDDHEARRLSSEADRFLPKPTHSRTK